MLAQPCLDCSLSGEQTHKLGMKHDAGPNRHARLILLNPKFPGGLSFSLVPTWKSCRRRNINNSPGIYVTDDNDEKQIRNSCCWIEIRVDVSTDLPLHARAVWHISEKVEIVVSRERTKHFPIDWMTHGEAIVCGMFHYTCVVCAAGTLANYWPFLFVCIQLQKTLHQLLTSTKQYTWKITCHSEWHATCILKFTENSFRIHGFIDFHAINWMYLTQSEIFARSWLFLAIFYISDTRWLECCHEIGCRDSKQLLLERTFSYRKLKVLRNCRDVEIKAPSRIAECQGTVPKSWT